MNRNSTAPPIEDVEFTPLKRKSHFKDQKSTPLVAVPKKKPKVVPDEAPGWVDATPPTPRRWPNTNGMTTMAYGTMAVSSIGGSMMIDWGGGWNVT